MQINRRKFVNVPHNCGWKNTELLKERGLIPYYMHINHGFESIMLGSNIDTYTYINDYVKGLKMEFLETGSNDEKLLYVKENAADIDVLMLDSLYNCNPNMIFEYKQLNPKGKIYLTLDANSAWMDRIPQDDTLKSIMDNCTIAATSCSAMQKHLNEKWPWPIYHIPNGYINLTGKTPPDYKEKENIILTCSRLGTRQKATNILLEAFALIHNDIPDYKLKLIGSMEESFKQYIEEYFIKHPDLKNKVIFTGIIKDKTELQQEYFNAKIFALPSTWEGGCPNVISEALYAGCVMAVTKFDAWEDCIDFGACGKACEINNINAFADILLLLAQNENLSKMSGRAHEYAEEHFNMSKITDRLYQLLFGGETNE